LVYQYAFHYTDLYRKNLEKFTKASEIEEYLEKQNILQDFVSWAATKDVPSDKAGLRVSGFIIKTQLEAYIARNIIGEEGFYPIIQEIDKTLLKTVDITRKNLLVENLP
jgi:carboxyl-terminal processing protease